MKRLSQVALGSAFAMAVAVSIASLSFAQSQSSGTQPSIRPVKTYPPQSGFNPLTASNAALIKHGYPPRPTGGPALRGWEEAMKNAKHYVAPHPTSSSVMHGGSASNARNSSTTSSSPVIQPIQTFSQPPAGFNPLTASAASLKKYGFPPRPTAPAALSLWSEAMQHATHYVPPNPVASSIMHDPPTHSGNPWSGYTIPSNGVHYTGSEARWTQPAVAGNSNYTNYNKAPDASFWTGIGTNNLIQAGADSIATATPQYRFWTENWPYEGTIWEGPVIRPGDLAYVDVQYNGNDTTTFFLENYTTGGYSSFTNYTPDVGWDAGDFINEQVWPSLPFPVYGSTSFAGASAGNNNTGQDLTGSDSTLYAQIPGVSVGPVQDGDSGFTLSN